MDRKKLFLCGKITNTDKTLNSLLKESLDIKAATPPYNIFAGDDNKHEIAEKMITDNSIKKYDFPFFHKKDFDSVKQFLSIPKNLFSPSHLDFFIKSIKFKNMYPIKAIGKFKPNYLLEFNSLIDNFLDLLKTVPETGSEEVYTLMLKQLLDYTLNSIYEDDKLNDTIKSGLTSLLNPSSEDVFSYLTDIFCKDDLKILYGFSKETNTANPLFKYFLKDPSLENAKKFGRIFGKFMASAFNFDGALGDVGNILCCIFNEVPKPGDLNKLLSKIDNITIDQVKSGKVWIPDIVHTDGELDDIIAIALLIRIRYNLNLDRLKVYLQVSEGNRSLFVYLQKVGLLPNVEFSFIPETHLESTKVFPQKNELEKLKETLVQHPDLLNKHSYKIKDLEIKKSATLFHFINLLDPDSSNTYDGEVGMLDLPDIGVRVRVAEPLTSVKPTAPSLYVPLSNMSMDMGTPRSSRREIKEPKTIGSGGGMKKKKTYKRRKKATKKRHIKRRKPIKKRHTKRR